ncbi:hypothetical protein PPACK8108_LOCUS15035 [Phakopsora pachyrhizi]|uniref:Uncharacterized protein n=1 Tax=Phakopsora pachyrhizi TaxID=170000 RepID=A0AAV0B9M2_PHAPC|nr:hypothetical protein PPACK8108_LOCUS15035 [Phakopsora pachyrhizi]
MAIIDESASLISKNYVISQNTSRRSVLCADNEDINIGRSISSISKLDGRLGEENLNSTDFEERSLSMLLNESNRGPEKRGAAYQTSSKRPPSHRIKPKVVPIYIASASGDVLLVKPREEMHTLIEIQNEKSEEEKNCEDEAQLDLKGKPLHCVGGEYMTNTVKLKWDFKMQEVSKALKED